MAKKIILVIVSLAVAFGCITVGLGIGIFLTQKSFAEERTQLEELKNQVENSISNEEFEEVESQLEERDVTIDKLEEEKKTLETQLEMAQQISEIPTGEAEEYISWKFYTDGNQYKTTNHGTVFYADPKFENSLVTSDVILISPVVTPEKFMIDSEFVTVYTARSTEGMVYCKKVPNLEPVN